MVSIAFHLCELEKKLIDAKMGLCCSPLLSGTIVWFLREFSQAYLMPNESYYNEVSIDCFIFNLKKFIFHKILDFS